MIYFHEKFTKLQDLILYEDNNKVLETFELLENKELSDNDFLDLILLKLQLYNYTAQYSKVLDLHTELYKNKELKIDIFYEFSFLVEKLAALAALNDNNEISHLMEQGNALLKICKEEKEKKYQFSIANYYLTVGGIIQQNFEFERALDYSDKGVEIFKNLKEPLGTAQALFLAGITYYLKQEFTKSMQLIDESLQISSKFKLNMYTAWALTHKAMALHYWGKSDDVPSLLLMSIKISKKIKNIHCEDYALTIFGAYSLAKGNIKNALKYYQESLKLRKIRGNIYEIVYVLCDLANLFSQMGDIKKNEYYLNEALKYPEVADHPLITPLLLITRAIFSLEKGEYSISNELLKQALILFKKIKDSEQIMRCFHYLISIELLNKNNNKVYEYLAKIKKWSDSMPDHLQIQQFALLEKAIIYKNSRDTYKELFAKKFLHNFVFKDIQHPDFRIEASICYIELLVKELKITKSYDTVQLIENINDELMQFAVENNKFTLISELFLFKAHLEVINLAYNKAMEYFTNAIKNAKKSGLDLLIIIISNEYDKILKIYSNTKNFQRYKVSFREKIRDFDFSFRFSKMTRNLQIYIPEKTEIPIFLEFWTIFGKNLTNVVFDHNNITLKTEIDNYLENELGKKIQNEFILNEKIDRMKQGSFTIIKDKINNVRIKYGFHGPSYEATKKLDLFIQCLENDTIFNIFIDKNGEKISEKIKILLNKKAKEIFL